MKKATFKVTYTKRVGGHGSILVIAENELQAISTAKGEMKRKIQIYKNLSNCQALNTNERKIYNYLAKEYTQKFKKFLNKSKATIQPL